MRAGSWCAIATARTSPSCPATAGAPAGPPAAPAAGAAPQEGDGTEHPQRLTDDHLLAASGVFGPPHDAASRKYHLNVGHGVDDSYMVSKHPSITIISNLELRNAYPGTHATSNAS